MGQRTQVKKIILYKEWGIFIRWWAPVCENLIMGLVWSHVMQWSSSVGFIKSLSVPHGTETSTVPCIFCWMNAGCAAPSELEEGGFGGMPWSEDSISPWSRKEGKLLHNNNCPLGTLQEFSKDPGLQIDACLYWWNAEGVLMGWWDEKWNYRLPTGRQEYVWKDGSGWTEVMHIAGLCPTVLATVLWMCLIFFLPRCFMYLEESILQM